MVQTHSWCTAREVVHRDSMLQFNVFLPCWRHVVDDRCIYYCFTNAYMFVFENGHWYFSDGHTVRAATGEVVVAM